VSETAAQCRKNVVGVLNPLPNGTDHATEQVVARGWLEIDGDKTIASH
jgi:hypothetical protein